MPVLTASQIILGILAGLTGIALFWVVGHEVERASESIGGAVLTPILQRVDKVLDPFSLMLGLVGIWLVMKGRG